MNLMIEHKGNEIVYTTDAGGVKVTTLHRNGLSTEEHYSFEDIKREKKLDSQTYPHYLIIAGILCSVAFVVSEEKSPLPWIALLIFGIVLAGLILGFVYHRKKVYLVKTFRGKYIQFPIKSNEPEISSFVEYIIDTRNKYLKFKYGSPNDFISYDNQYSNFNILLREGVITEEEYKKNISELSQTFQRTLPGKVGDQFSQN